jgi:hypothetical protein
MSFLQISVKAQDIYIKVKKGSVIHNSKTINDSNPAFHMRKSDKITVTNGSILSARFGESYFQIPSGKSYTFDDLKNISQFNINKSSVFDVIFKNTMQITKNNYGSTTRGTEYEPNYYAPIDSLLVLDKKFQLEIGNRSTKLKKNITVKNESNGKVIYDEKPENLMVELSNLPAAKYSWTYVIEFIKGDSLLEVEYLNTFIVPSEKVRASMLKNYNKFKAQLQESKKNNLITDDFYNILLEEYKMENKIYTKQ